MLFVYGTYQRIKKNDRVTTGSTTSTTTGLVRSTLYTSVLSMSIMTKNSCHGLSTLLHFKNVQSISTAHVNIA